MKKLLALLTVLVLTVPGTYSHRPRQAQAIPAIKYADMTDAKTMLEYMYAANNEAYFNGRLPKDTRIVYTTPIPYGAIGDTESTVPITIYIDSYYNRNMVQADETLLHEQCHVAVPIGLEAHGPEWQGCMYKLADNRAFEGLW